MQSFDPQHLQKVFKWLIKLAALPKDLTDVLSRHGQVRVIIPEHGLFNLQRIGVAHHGLVLVTPLQVGHGNVVQHNSHAVMLVAEAQPTYTQAFFE